MRTTTVQWLVTATVPALKDGPNHHQIFTAGQREICKTVVSHLYVTCGWFQALSIECVPTNPEPENAEEPRS